MLGNVVRFIDELKAKSRDLDADNSLLSLQRTILRPFELATLFDTSERVVIEMARRGEMPGKKIGRGWLFDRTSIEEWFRWWPSKGQGRTLPVTAERQTGVEANLKVVHEALPAVDWSIKRRYE